ncbi:hypothetical protein AB0C28_02730 [Nonomuraea sp. NPDC048892]|uniref:hypothetical protein n=1 Tax=Nonomuraea sp. NPDC048892 TaxID=3154624 RepID=UPI0033FAD073
MFNFVLPSLFTAGLAAHGKDLPFRARIVITWRLPVGAEVSSEALVAAGDLLAKVAAETTRSFSVLHREEAESALNMKLRRIRIDPAPSSIQVTLAVEPEDVEFAQQQRMRDLEVLRQQAEVGRLLVLRDTVLRDAPTARLWWLGADRNRLADLAKHADDIERAVALVAPVEKANVSRPDEVVITKLVDQFLSELDTDSRWLLLQQLGMVFRNYDRGDLATQLSAATLDSAVSLRSDSIEANGTSPINDPP